MVTTGPVQTPPVMVSTSPTRPAALESSGRVFQRGAAIAATAVWSLRADAEPSGLVAVTTATSALPMSAATSLYWTPAAPAIGWQPPASQRSQETLYVVSAVVCQVAPDTVSS